MDAQLHFLPEADAELPAPEAPPRTEWRIDDSTRAVGRRGIQRARAALQSAARQRHLGDDPRHASAA